MHKQSKQKVGIVGARGYSGTELARLLLKHPNAEISACFAGEKDFSLSSLLPESAAEKIPTLPIGELKEAAKDLDAVFLATPAEASLELAPLLLKNETTDVIDLSGAFRLSGESAYPKWYGFFHPHQELIAQATFGLSPWVKIPSGKGRLVANPGCYSTSVLMAIIPLLKSQLIEASSLVIDAKSGTSGAGKKAAENLNFTEVEGECLPYRVGKHQHLPEITQWAETLSGTAIDPFFTTSLLPVRRGIISGIYAHLKSGKTSADVAEAFAQSYENYPLVKVNGANALSLKKVVGTARTHIQFQVVGEKLYLFSLIDNLLKGAASQAVENFNSLYGYPAAFSLEGYEGVL